MLKNKKRIGPEFIFRFFVLLRTRYPYICLPIAYNFLTLQDVTKIEHDSEAELNVTLNGEGCEPAKVVEAGVDEGDRMEDTYKKYAKYQFQTNPDL